MGEFYLNRVTKILSRFIIIRFIFWSVHLSVFVFSNDVVFVYEKYQGCIIIILWAWAYYAYKLIIIFESFKQFFLVFVWLIWFFLTVYVVWKHKRLMPGLSTISERNLLNQNSLAKNWLNFVFFFIFLISIILAIFLSILLVEMCVVFFSARVLLTHISKSLWMLTQQSAQWCSPD